MRILIVDDDPGSAEALGMLLGALGHTALPVCSGREAIASISTFVPEIVILDIGLQDISGYDVARTIRERADGARLHLVAATGWGTPEDRIRAMAAGFDQHHVKPIDLPTLTTILAVASKQLTASSA